jgi:Skp family chaperone for outer membrane proteins
MKRILISCALLSSCATAMLLAEIKVGYISSSEIITKSKIGKEIKGKIDTVLKKSSTEMQAAEQKINSAMNEYKTKEAAMSESAREAKQAELMKMRRDFEGMAQEKEEEFKRLQAKLNDRLTKEILETAADMGKAEGYDELKDIDSGRTLYVNPNYVVTSKYIGRMDKKYDVEHAPKAAPAKKA